MMFRIGSVIACVSLSVSLTSAGLRLEAASIIRVPADQPTIQSAISAASNGDTVQVAAGTYVENLNFSGKAISVTSVQGPAVRWEPGWSSCDVRIWRRIAVGA